MATQTFEVEDIHCDGCEHAIRRAVGRIEGVAHVEADHTTNRVDVEYDDSRVDAAVIVERLTTAGYPVLT